MSSYVYFFWAVETPSVLLFFFLLSVRHLPFSAAGTSLPDEHAALYERLHVRYAGPVLTLFTDLGGLYIKTGQYLSVRPEIVPTAFRTKLKTLQSDVPGRPYDDIVPIVEAELGPLAESFSSFSEEHIGAASIGQAHRATTVDGGDEVVVKVMYPDAEVNFKADLACIEGMINLGIYMEALDGDSMKGFFKELQQQFMAELDFRKEVANLNEIRGSTGAAYEGYV